MSPPQRPPSIQKLEAALADTNLSEARRAELLAELAWELRRLDTQESLRLAEEAHSLASQHHHQKALAASLLARGFARSRLAQYQDAQADAQEALHLFEQLPDSHGSYRALNLLGVTYGQMGDYNKALKTFLETHTLCEMLADSAGAAAALNNAALSHTYLSDYASALELNLRALAAYESLKDSEGSSRTLTNIGSAHMELKRYEEALSSFQQALNRQGRWHDQHVNATILLSMARCYYALHRLDEAYSNTKKSKGLFEALEDKQGQAQAVFVLGLIALEQQDFSQAEALLSNALAAAQSIGDPLLNIQSRLELARVHRLTVQQSSTEPLLMEALELAKKLEARAEIYRVHLSLAEFYESIHAFEKALYHHKRYTELKDEVFNDASDRKLQSLQVSFQVEQTEREREIYRLKNVELAAANVELQNLNRSLQKLDRQKSNLLKQLERQALEDSLTGLFNRRHFDQQTQVLYAQTQATNSHLSIMICDIDNFKAINDTFSHQVGDEVLIEVATLFKKAVRQSDILARYGGEEFVLAMPDTPLEVALIVCERLRYSIESHLWQNIHPDLRVTISLGISSDLSAGNFEKMISLADEKLYQAKRNGKNQVCA